jgi:hypothetical protein
MVSKPEDSEEPTRRCYSERGAACQIFRSRSSSRPSRSGEWHEMRILILFEKVWEGKLLTIHAYELVKHVLFTRIDADEPGMRVVLHEEQRERLVNAGSLLQKGRSQLVET